MLLSISCDQCKNKHTYVWESTDINKYNITWFIALKSYQIFVVIHVNTKLWVLVLYVHGLYVNTCLHRV